MSRGKTHCLEVWGELACFTRPEMKVERYSYPVITPSAGRGIFDAIYWKRSSSFYWQLECVEVLSPPKYVALRRNEVKEKAPSDRSLKAWMDGREAPEPLWADAGKEEAGTDQKGRTQRQTMALKNVRYRLHAHIEIRDRNLSPDALDAQFVRRATHGKCFYQPYLGCREFPAWFELRSNDDRGPSPIAWDADLGFMLYDVFDLSRDNASDAKPAISVFQAVVTHGVMKVPDYRDEAVRKPDAGGSDA
jgi:CRISPR-associated protein Cas5d